MNSSFVSIQLYFSVLTNEIEGNTRCEGLFHVRSRFNVVDTYSRVLFVEIQTESRQIEYQMNELNFLISPAWAKGGIEVSDPIVLIEKCRNQTINFVHLVFHLS